MRKQKENRGYLSGGSDDKYIRLIQGTLYLVRSRVSNSWKFHILCEAMLAEMIINTCYILIH